MTTISINVITPRKIIVNLTDGRDVWGKQEFRSAGKALAYVAQLLNDGVQVGEFSQPVFERLTDATS